MITNNTAIKNIAILHFAGPPVVGGVEKVMLEHALLMSKAGHKVTIIAGEGSKVDQQIKFIKIPLAHSRHADILEAKKALDQGKIPKSFDSLVAHIYTSLKEALKEIDICFIHNVLTMTKNLALVAALKKYFRDNPIKLIAWHHDIAATSKRYKDEVHEGYPWELVTKPWQDIPIRHITVSEARKAELIFLFKLQEKEIQVIPSGISPNDFYKLEPQTRHLVDLLKLNKATPLLLLPMRITRRKNIQLALKITAALKKDLPGASLVVTGPPGAHNPSNSVYANELISLRETLSKDLDCTIPLAHFLFEHTENYLPDEVIRDFYRLADGLLVTSIDEGLGIPIMEAGFSRIPVFCSNILPFHETALDLANYFELNDKPENIAKNMTEFFKSDPLHSMKDRMRKHYSWDSIFENQIKTLLV